MHILSQLVGVSFRGAGIKALVQSLETGTEFTLEADPENPYDSNAVKVLYTDDNDETQFIGFLSKESNAETAEHLGNGLKVKCELLDMAGTPKPILNIELIDEPVEGLTDWGDEGAPESEED